LAIIVYILPNTVLSLMLTLTLLSIYCIKRLLMTIFNVKQDNCHHFVN